VYGNKRYDINNEIVVWVSPTDDSRAYEVGERHFYTGYKMEVLTQKAHLHRIIANWTTPYNIGDFALLSKHWNGTGQMPLSFIADMVRLYWMDS